MQLGKFALGLILVLPVCLAQSVAPGSQLNAIDLNSGGASPMHFDLSGHTTVVVFTSTQCPVSNAYNDRMKALYSEYAPRGVQFVFLNANAGESAADIERHAKEHGFPFQVYRDAGNKIADELDAQVTPHAFVFDRRGVLVYRGAIDNARNAASVTKQPLREALDAVVAGRAVSMPEAKAFGCSIKRVN